MVLCMDRIWVRYCCISVRTHTFIIGMRIETENDSERKRERWEKIGMKTENWLSETCVCIILDTKCWFSSTYMQFLLVGIITYINVKIIHWIYNLRKCKSFFMSFILPLSCVTVIRFHCSNPNVIELDWESL